MITCHTTSSFKFSPSVFLNNVPGNGSEELASKLLRNLNFYFCVFNLIFLFCVFVLFLCKNLFIKSRLVFQNPCLKNGSKISRISFLPFFDKDIITASVAVPAPCQIKAGELTDCLVVGFINSRL